MTRHNLSESRGMRSRDDDRFVDAIDDAVCDASTSLAGDDPERESTDAFVDARESWARSFPLHKCAWDNDVEGVRALLRAPGTDANALDFAGHAPLHVAALRRAVGATKALCECARVDPEARDARGWTPTRLALHRRARGCLRAIVRAKRRRKREMMALERPKLAAALADIGDFETRVGWRFGSAVLAPLVKMVAPRDTYAVTCANGKLRVDGELRGIDSDALGRSVLPKWRRGKFSLIFNRGARGEPAELWFVDHESRDVVNAMERANETEESRASMSAMSGDSATSEPMTEEEIVAATVEAMLADGAPKRRTRADDLTFAPARGWISRRASAWVRGHKTEVWEAAATMTRETIAPGGGFALDGTFDEYVESAAGARDDVVERVPLGASSIDHSGLREKETKEKEAPTTRKMKARCWLTRDFPLDAARAARILDVLERANTSARRVNRVVKYWRDNHTGLFPIKIQVPLAFSIYAQLHFKDYATIDARRADTLERDGFFDVPAEYSVKTVDEMMVEVEERAKRDVERMEAFERTLENESGAEETEEMKRMRLEFERVAKLELDGGEEYPFADDDDDDDDDDDEDARNA